MSFFRRKLISAIGERPIIDQLPATANLVAFWDAADSSSWSGSGTWDNLVTSPADGAAQSAYDLQLVSTPTFTGTVGGLSSSEYWGLSDSTGFELSTNTTFTAEMHQSDSEWTMAWIVDVDTDSSWTLASTLTAGSTANRGFSCGSGFAQIINAGGFPLQSWTPGTGFHRFTWSLDADVNPVFEYSIDGTLTTPSLAPGGTDTSRAADAPLVIANFYLRGSYSSGIASGKLYAVVLWNKRLSSAEVTTFNDAFSGRFGY